MDVWSISGHEERRRTERSSNGEAEMIFRLEGEGEEGGGASGSRNLYGTTIEESTSIEVGSEFSEEDVMNFRDALHGKAAFSAPEQRYTDEIRPGLKPGPRSFFDRIDGLHKGIKDFRHELREIQKGFRGVLFPNEDPECQPIPKVDTTKALLKLEVMESWEVDFCVVALYTAIALGFLYTTLFTSFTKGEKTPEIISSVSKFLMMTYAFSYATAACITVILLHVFPFQADDQICGSFTHTKLFICTHRINFMSFLLALFYIVRIAALSRPERTDEQFWTCVLVTSGLLGESPFTEFPTLMKVPNNYERMNELYGWSILVDAVYIVCTYFFLVCTAHSYRILGNWDFHRLRFYSPKFILIGIYLMCRVSFEYFGRVHLGFVPLTRLINLSFFIKSGWMSTQAIVAVTAVTCLDAAILLWFMREISRTRMFLAQLNYMETREKQLGFRFFLYSSLCFVAAISLIDAYLMGGIPEEKLRALEEHLNYVEFEPVVGKLGLSIMYFTWLALTVYGNFPAGKSLESAALAAEESNPSDTLGELEQGSADSDVPRSLLYKHRDWPLREVAQRNHTHWTNVFVMEVQILMINCAWLAYIPMNKDEEKQSGSADPEKDEDGDLYRVDMYEILEGTGMHIFRHIYDNQDDGHCIVLEAEDRVIVSFGGTRQGSMKNWKANFRFNQVKWSEMFEPLSVVRYSGTDELQGSELSTKKSIFNQVAEEVKTFNEIKVHAGFAHMYRRQRAEMMSVLRSLYERDKASSRRLLFFTGHSLGGAMATLASYDCALNFRRLGLRTRKQIQVTTFGTPKVGNLAWKTSYDKKVGRHWRFVLASDVITKMPQDWNYFHVGVKVLLDWSGMLLVDPSFVEVRWWHTVYTSTTLHTRASYYLSMRSWCKRYRDADGRADDLHEAFWPWPIRPQACRLFVNVEATPGT